MVRILLLLLPISVALLLYMEGQRYDPALIDFTASVTRSPSAFLPGSIAGYERTGAPREFTEENLYEYVNGHAEYYISAGFVSLSVGEYAQSPSGGTSPEVVVEVFDLGNALQAFGVLADEAGDIPLGSEVGAFSLKSSRGISFTAGNYYVKINIFDDDASLLEIAGRIAEDIGGEADFRALFSKFPDIGPPVATRFIRESYRGIDFLNNVIEREYSLNGETVHIFLVSDDEGGTGHLTESFIGFFDDSGIDYRVHEAGGRPYYEVVDPYEGDWYLVPGATELYGIYDVPDHGTAIRILERIGS